MWLKGITGVLWFSVADSLDCCQRFHGEERSFQPVADSFVMVKESKLGHGLLEATSDVKPMSKLWRFGR